MAGKGPPRKDPATRKRRNSPPSSSAALPAGGRRDALGRRLPVPKIQDQPWDSWHAYTVRWWREMWHSPQATQWTDTDRLALEVVALLYEELFTVRDRGGSVSKLTGEIRLQEARFGITVADRRRLEWTIAADEEAASLPDQVAEYDEERGDPRLRVVGGTETGD